MLPIGLPTNLQASLESNSRSAADGRLNSSAAGGTGFRSSVSYNLAFGGSKLSASQEASEASAIPGWAWIALAGATVYLVWKRGK